MIWKLYLIGFFVSWITLSVIGARVGVREDELDPDDIGDIVILVFIAGLLATVWPVALPGVALVAAARNASRKAQEHKQGGPTGPSSPGPSSPGPRRVA